MPGDRGNGSSGDFQIIFQSLFHLCTEVDNHFISSFSQNPDAIIFEIYITYIQSHQFGNTNTCSEQESNHGNVAVLLLVIVIKLYAGQLISIIFNMVQKIGHLIGI